MKILRIAMDGEEHPQYTISEAFDAIGNIKTIWWEKHKDLNAEIIHEVTNGNYDAVFMQIQADGIINEEAAKAIHKYSIGFNWTGDVRTDISWFIKLGKYFVTCFTNMTDVLKMKSLGMNSEYLQVGYDHKYYYPKESVCYNNIVFCANYYPHYPLAKLREQVVFALKREFKDKFNLYGNGWLKVGLHSECAHVNNEQEAEIYRTAAIAINCSQFNYSRYSSDRLFREMACGAFVLSHRFKDYELDFSESDNLVTWTDMPDLIKKCHHYLANPEERKRIGNNAAKFALEKCTWTERLKDFVLLVEKYKKPIKNK